MEKRLLFATMILLSAIIKAQNVTLNCGQNTLLFPQQNFSVDTQNIDISADKSEISKNDVYNLSGNVTLNTAQYHLQADKVIIEKTSNKIIADGAVKFQDSQLMLSGEKALIEKRDEAVYGIFSAVKFHYPLSKINGSADKFTSAGNTQIFADVTYTLCPLGETDWQIKADKITLNEKENKGIAEGVVIEFLSVPIFYAPHYEWALKGRESGFLPPSFAYYNEQADAKNSNYQIKIPYYFNIAPDRDLLLTLNHLSSRGEMLQGKYRQLIAGNKGRFEIDGNYLNKDKIIDKNRWMFNSKLDLWFNPKTNLKLKTQRVSDADYFKQIAHENTAATALYSDVNLSYKDEENQLAWSVFAESEQLVNSGTATYTKAPEIALSKNIKRNDRSVELSFTSSQFRHQDSSKPSGIRTHAQAKFIRNIRADAYLLIPSLTLSNTNYALDDAADKNRSMSSFHLDSKYFLQRKTRLFDTPLIQTLTPRIAYHYTPKKDQNALPNFDSSEKFFSYDGLFAAQRLTGIDRINEANDVIIGFESEFIDAETGDAYLALKMAQSFYLDPQIINNILTDSSDIAFSADYSLDNFTFNNTLQYDPKSAKINKRDSAISYQLDGEKFLTLTHQTDLEDETAELSAAYPINSKIHIFAGINRSLSASINNKQTLGMAYESCCWAWRLAHFKKHLGDDNYDNITRFELVLKGLTSTSTNFYKRLKTDIPGYFTSLND